jgi:c(7)-type cytochrome triheme protein
VRRLLQLAVVLLVAVALETPGMPMPGPAEFGRVILERSAQKAKVPPVAFDHWRHRARFTCRLCHVDVGFAMRAGTSEITAASNRDGYHCGACHDGQRKIRGKLMFASCDPERRIEPGTDCVRCHRRADGNRSRKEYETFTQGLPRSWSGLVDWEKAEADGLIRPADYLEGVSIKRDAIKNRKEITIASKAEWMTNVRFSHPKHAVWNGCEVCHPDIFPNAGGQERRYTMFSINSGEACGACHDKVAFPLAECERCHVKPVQ